MTKQFSFVAKKNAQGALQVIASEQMLSEAGKPMGQVQADISASLASADAASLSALLVSLQAVLEAQ